MRKQVPVVTVTHSKTGYTLDVRGQFGGGYTLHPSEAEIVSRTLEALTRYNCGNGIRLVCEADMRQRLEAAGWQDGQTQAGRQSAKISNFSRDILEQSRLKEQSKRGEDISGAQWLDEVIAAGLEAKGYGG